MISLRFLKRSAWLENETDIQFRVVSEEEEKRVHLFSFTFFWIQTEERTASGAVILCQRGLAVLQEVDDLIPIVTQCG